MDTSKAAMTWARPLSIWLAPALVLAAGLFVILIGLLLYVPLAGPFIQMGFVSGTGTDTMRTLLAVDGAVQIAGLAVAVIEGAMLSTPGRHARASAVEKLHLSPFASATTAGIGAAGTF